MSSVIKRSASGSCSTMTAGYPKGAHVMRKDPASLLARGFTARYVGAILQAYKGEHAVTALSAEEVDRDLRHICAYQEAASRYQQLTYAVTNHIAIHQKSAQEPSAEANDAPLALPVRIDPEEEKRRFTAHQRIQRAELVREELEQHYVALRAHYVVTTQELQQFAQDSAKTLEYLQQQVAATAMVLGAQRARLQMTRDVAAALRRRTHRVEHGGTTLKETDDAANQDENAGSAEVSMDVPPPSTSSATTSSTPDHQCPMLAAWTAVEEELKRLAVGSNKGGKGGGGSTKGKASSSSGAVLPWSCTQEPATSFGIPQLLSALSTQPEKSIAVHTGGMFGSHPHNLTWLEAHLPPLMDEDGEDVATHEGAVIEQLRAQVQKFETELLRERQANQEILSQTGQARALHDEWVAMTSLVRQETEAVLHRHNVLMDSDEVLEAIQASDAAHAATVAPKTEDTADKGAVPEDAAAEDEVAPLSSRKLRNDEEEGASEADDEGMEEEGEEVDDWDANGTTTSKRGAAGGPEDSFEGGSPVGSRKRRKL